MGTYQDLVAEQHHKEQAIREQEQRDAALYVQNLAAREQWAPEDLAEVLGALGLDTTPLPG